MWFPQTDTALGGSTDESFCDDEPPSWPSDAVDDDSLRDAALAADERDDAGTEEVSVDDAEAADDAGDELRKCPASELEDAAPDEGEEDDGDAAEDDDPDPVHGFWKTRWQPPVQLPLASHFGTPQ